MNTVYLAKSSEIFVQALQCYKKHLKLAVDFKTYEKGTILSATRGDITLILNDEPEKMDGIRVIQVLREEPTHCAVPIIFLSEGLSEDAQVMFKDFELTWMCALPFHSGEFMALLEKVPQWMKENAAVLTLRLQVAQALHEKRSKEAYQLAKSLSTQYSSPFRAHVLVAHAALLVGKYDEAFDQVNKALAINKLSLEANGILAKVHHLRGDKALAGEVIQNTMKAAEIYLRNLIHWGDVYVERGESARSITAYEAALDKDPANQRVKDGLLAANLIEGRTSLVQNALAQAGAATDLARICNLKGIAMANAGKYQVAERLYNNAMNFLPKEDSSAHKLWLNLGLCMKKKGDLKAALNYFRKCREVAPADYDRIEPQITQTERQIAARKTQGEGEEPDLLADVTLSSSTLNYGKKKRRDR